jgi:hypothetical protein
MPTFRYTGSGPSAPVSYTMGGREAPAVEGRVFGPGEHVEAAENPDESLFELVEESE